MKTFEVVLLVKAAVEAWQASMLVAPYVCACSGTACRVRTGIPFTFLWTVGRELGRERSMQS